MSLYRKEAIEYQMTRLSGVVCLAQPLSTKITVATLITCSSLVVAFLCLSEYSRKETVHGFLVPDKGVIRSYARQGGVVEKIYVSEGDQVAKNDPLITLVLPRQIKSGEGGVIEVFDAMRNQMRRQLELLDQELVENNGLKSREIEHLKHRKRSLLSEEEATETQYALAKSKLALLGSQQKNLQKLQRNGYVSRIEFEQRQQTLLEQQQEKHALARILVQVRGQLDQIDYQLTSVPKRYKLQATAIERERIEIQNKFTQMESTWRYTISAAKTGTVAGIQVLEGESIAFNRPLLHIVPSGSKLIAELLLPSRSAGFVKTGDTIRIRFDAFPYQRYGFIEGQITQIDRTLVRPHEASMPIQLDEPFYRLTGTLTEQQLAARNTQFDLKSGMLFQADIMLEKRTLIEWLFEPILSLRGRIS